MTVHDTYRTPCPSGRTRLSVDSRRMAVARVVELCDRSVVAHSGGTGRRPKGTDRRFVCSLSPRRLPVLGMG
jgi:hypothetical protein